MRSLISPTYVLALSVLCNTINTTAEVGDITNAALRQEIQEISRKSSRNLTDSAVETIQVAEPLERYSDEARNATEVATKHFIVKIYMTKDNVKRAIVKELQNKTNIIDLGSPLVRPQEPTSIQKATGTSEEVPNEDRETLKNALLGEVVGKLSRGEFDNERTPDLSDTKDPLRSVKARVAKRHKMTRMFVRFLQDLAGKLDLDVVTVAEQLINKSNRAERSKLEMSTGYVRDIIPSLPMKYLSIINLISSKLEDELKTARLLYA